MIAYRYHEILLEMLQEAQQEESDALTHGLAQDWGDYNRRAGRVLGLEKAIDIAEEARRKVME